jgi:hypothetical protein
LGVIRHAGMADSLVFHECDRGSGNGMADATLPDRSRACLVELRRRVQHRICAAGKRAMDHISLHVGPAFLARIDNAHRVRLERAVGRHASIRQRHDNFAASPQNPQQRHVFAVHLLSHACPVGSQRRPCVPAPSGLFAFFTRYHLKRRTSTQHGQRSNLT